MGPGEFAGVNLIVTAPGSDRVELVGAGPSSTTFIQPDGGIQTVVDVGPGGAAKSLGVRMSGLPGAHGVDLRVGAVGGSDLRVERSVGVGGIGVVVTSNAAVRGLVVRMPINTDQLGVRLGDGATLTDADVAAREGIELGGTSRVATVRRARIRAHRGVSVADGARLTLDVALVELVGDGIAVAAEGGTTSGQEFQTQLNARRVTLVGTETTGSIGLRAGAASDGSALVRLEDSIVEGFDHNVNRFSPSSSHPANISLRGCDIDLEAGDISENGPGQITSALALEGLDERFAAPALRDYRLRFDSPLVDRAVLPTGAVNSATDVLGQPERDGNGDGATVADVGAFEYQRADPQISLSLPPSATPGSPVALSVTATDSDPGEQAALAASWDADGTALSGFSPFHSFAVAGQRRVSVTVTDPAGASATAAGTVIVPRIGGGERDASNAEPDSDIRAPRRGVRSRRLRKLVGTAFDPEGRLAGVDLAVTRLGKCSALRPNGRLAPGKRPCSARFRLRGRLGATRGGRTRWSLRLPRPLPPGRYLALSRARDLDGGREDTFTRRDGNRVRFRIAG